MDPNASRLRIQDIVIKLAVFANDTTFIVNDVESLKRIINVMKQFEKHTPLKAGVSKCGTS